VRVRPVPQAAAPAARRSRLRARHPRLALPPLASAAEALEWFDAEWPNLSELLRATVLAGRHRHAWQLVLLTSHYLTTRSTYPDWSHWGLTGLNAARAVRDTEARC